MIAITHFDDPNRQVSTSVGTMPDLKKRLILGALGLVLTFGLVACNGDDGPPDTTSPGGPDTTAPVGS